MKKILSLLVLSIFLLSSTFAYAPYTKDKELVNSVVEKLYKVIEKGGEESLNKLLKKLIKIRKIEKVKNNPRYKYIFTEIFNKMYQKKLNLKNKELDEKLIDAIEKNDVEQVKLLLEYGANPDAKAMFGRTALNKTSWISPNEKRFEIVKLLLEYGANPNIRANTGYTTLMKAIIDKNKEIVKILLEYGTDPNIKEDIGLTPLIGAVQSGDVEIIKLLLDNGSNPNFQDINGKTPLMNAAQGGTVEIVKLLLENGADVNIKNNNGETALTIWKSGNKNHYEINKLLIKYGTNYPTFEETFNKSSQNLIIGYYMKISNKEFEYASNMTAGKNKKTAQQLENTYKNIKVAIPYDVQEINKNTYKFYVYYVDEGDEFSQTYEIVKRIVDGKLESVSGKKLEGINPEEFQINDSENKYEVFYRGEKNVYDFFNIKNGGAKFRAQESLDIYLEYGSPTEEEKKLVEEKNKYFENIFSKYSETDVLKEYQIIDKKFIYGKDLIYNEHEDSYDPELSMTDQGIRIFVIPNKGNYDEGSEQFIKDFTINSGILDSKPIKAGKDYFIIENFQYCGAQICPFGIDELREMIKSDNFVIN